MATLAQDVRTRSPALAGRPIVAWPALVLLVGTVAVAVGWTGFIASDDQFYYFGALEWAQNGAFAGDSHWTTRFPLVLTLAAAIKAVGADPLALHLTAIAWYAAFVAVGILLTRRVAGDRAGWMAGLLFASMPLIATGGSIVNCDNPEAVFLMLGAWLLAGAVERLRLSRCLLAGVAFGLAMLSRETAVLALSGLGILFLLGSPFPRWALVAVGCGAGLVLLGEAAFQWAMTGDPLHRYTLAFNHDSSLDRAANEEGNLLLHPAVDPLLVLFVNNEFALLFWLAIPAALAMRRGGMGWRRFAPVLAMGAASFLLVALLSHKLVLNPRYFTPTAVAATILVAAWLARMAPKRAATLLTVAVAANLAMLSLQNNHPRWEATALAQAAAADPSRAVAAAPETVSRAELSLRWAGLSNVRRDARYALVAADEAGGFELVERYPAPWRPAGALLAFVGIEIDRLKAGQHMALVRLY
ncbi:MAG: ArnT family glycosyltransferase [Allosphingosinicella sp.]|uniref:ArnT family glycosyltransferase n=1 Tax=Allosphingosinicella sp. TaxID=2823234 RepID=UPI003937604D